MEELKYKVVLDAQDVPAYLESLKQQIDMTMENTGQKGFGLPAFGTMPVDQQFATPKVAPLSQDFYGAPQILTEQLAPMSYSNVPSLAPIQTDPSIANFAVAPQFAPTTIDPISMAIPTGQEMQNWLERSSELIQSGYYKATAGIQSIRSTAALAKYNLGNYLSREQTPISQQSPFQTFLSTQGLGYDPLESTLSRKEWMGMAEQRFKDNFDIGMADWSFPDLVLEGGMAGATIGGFGGWAGMGIGAIAGATGAAAMYLGNEVVKPFRQEALFKRNITRGLRNYTPYTTGGAMNLEDRMEVANYLSNRDLSQELVGQHIGREDIEGMFNQMLDTSYMKESVNSDDMIRRIKEFTKSFTDVMHIFRVSKEEVGKIVDQLNTTGILDVFSGNIGAASRYIEASGLSARLDPNQALQMYQSGSEMLRGTGVAMGAGGDLVLDTLSDIKNLLASQNIDKETIRQLGGDTQAAFTMANAYYQQATTPGAFLMETAMSQGLYDPSNPAYQNIMGGLGTIRSIPEFLAAKVENMNFLSQPGNIEYGAQARMLGLVQNIEKLYPDLSEDELAMMLHLQTGMALPQVQLQLQSLSAGGENAEKRANEYLETVSRRVYQDQPTTLEEVTDEFSNFFTGIWRNVFQIGKNDLPDEVSISPNSYAVQGILTKEIFDANIFKNVVKPKEPITTEQSLLENQSFNDLMKETPENLRKELSSEDGNITLKELESTTSPTIETVVPGEEDYITSPFFRTFADDKVYKIGDKVLSLKGSEALGDILQARKEALESGEDVSLKNDWFREGRDWVRKAIGFNVEAATEQDIEQLIESDLGTNILGGTTKDMLTDVADYILNRPDLEKASDEKVAQVLMETLKEEAEFLYKSQDEKYLENLKEDFKLSDENIKNAELAILNPDVYISEDYGNVVKRSAVYIKEATTEEERKIRQASVDYVKGRAINELPEEDRPAITPKQPLEERWDDLSTGILKEYQSEISNRPGGLVGAIFGTADEDLKGREREARLVEEFSNLNNDAFLGLFGEELTKEELQKFMFTPEEKMTGVLKHLDLPASYKTDWINLQKKYVTEESKEGGILYQEFYEPVKNTTKESNRVLQEYLTSGKASTELIEALTISEKEGEITFKQLTDENFGEVASIVAGLPEDERTKISKFVESESSIRKSGLLSRMAGFDNKQIMEMTAPSVEFLTTQEQQQYTQLQNIAQKSMELSTQYQTIVKSDGTVERKLQMDPFEAARTDAAAKTATNTAHMKVLLAAILHNQASGETFRGREIDSLIADVLGTPEELATTQ